MPRYQLAFFLLAAGVLLAAAPEPPKLRLGDEVTPVRYRLDLTLIPEEETFSGRIEMDLDIRKPVSIVWLNARELKFDDAKFIRNGHTSAAKVEDGAKNSPDSQRLRTSRRVR